MIDSCNCRQKCLNKIPEANRKEIYSSYWKMDLQRRRDFLTYSIETKEIKRRVLGSKEMRQKTLEYKFKDIIVSKKNFLSTLGYKHDSVIRCLLSSNEKNTRKDWSFPRYERTIRTNKLPESYKEKVVKFIESFRPCPSHYRILHAPNRRYLPPGLTASAIFTQLNQMLASENGKSCSWSYFHNIYKSMNISSSTPENDKCSLCTEHERMFCIS